MANSKWQMASSNEIDVCWTLRHPQTAPPPPPRCVDASVRHQSGGTLLHQHCLPAPIAAYVGFSVHEKTCQFPDYGNKPLQDDLSLQLRVPVILGWSVSRSGNKASYVRPYPELSKRFHKHMPSYERNRSNRWVSRAELFCTSCI